MDNLTHSLIGAALGATAAYVLVNLVISYAATFLDKASGSDAVANAVPVKFWEREVIWRAGSEPGYDLDYGNYRWSLIGPKGTEEPSLKTNMTDPRIALWSKNDPAAQAFLFWSRMPIAELHDDRIILRDQRFMDPRTAAQFSVTLRPPK